MSGKSVTVSLASTVIRLAIFAAIVVFVFRLATAAYDFGYRVFAEPPVSDPPGLDISVGITDDMSTMDIGKMLENQGLIADGRLFFVQEKVSEYKGKIKPGTYTLNTSMTAEEMLAVIAADTSSEEETEAYNGNSDSATDTEGTTEFYTEESTETPEESTGSEE